MAYGTVKVDNITFDNGGSDQNVTTSGIYRAITSGITVTGTISGAVVIGSTSVSGTTVAGTTANFSSGIFTTQVSGVTVTGTTSNFTSGNFVSLSGVTATFTSGVIASGTAAAPSLSIVGDGNTGIYSPGADQLAVATNGSGRLFVNSTGQVGVANSSPGVAFDVTGEIRASTTVSDTAGNVRIIPQNSQSGSYTLAAADLGKHINITTGGVTVPASIFSTGDVVSIYNNSGSNQTITQGGSVTLRQAGTANTGNRTLAQYGIATVLCVSSNTFVISGAGLT